MDLDAMQKRVQELHALRPTIEQLANLAPRLQAAVNKMEAIELPKETSAATDDFKAAIKSLSDQVSGFGDRLTAAEARIEALVKFQDELVPHLESLAGVTELLEWLQAARPALEEVTKLAEPVEETPAEAAGETPATGSTEEPASEAPAQAGS